MIVPIALIAANRMVVFLVRFGHPPRRPGQVPTSSAPELAVTLRTAGFEVNEHL
jgi:hypothetical protein